MEFEIEPDLVVVEVDLDDDDCDFVPALRDFFDGDGVDDDDD